MQPSVPASTAAWEGSPAVKSDILLFQLLSGNEDGTLNRSCSCEMFESNSLLG